MSSDYSIIELTELEKIAKAEKEQWERRSIYKLPKFVTDKQDSVYTPRIVSFGPYHYGNKNLEEMESHKERALKRFLKRSGLDHNDCRRSLLEIVEELMDAYDGLDSKLYNKGKPDEFVDIMIRDGIFMLEIFRNVKKRAEAEMRQKGEVQEEASGYAEAEMRQKGEVLEEAFGYAYNDPIFSEHGDSCLIPHIRRDMLLLENQIPMKVLQRLYNLQPQEEKDEDAKKRMQGNDANKAAEKPIKEIYNYFKSIFLCILGKDAKKEKPANKEEVDATNKTVFNFFFPYKPTVAMTTNSLHILDLYRTAILGTYPKNESKQIEVGSTEDIIKSATELKKHGITIKKSKSRGVRNISFDYQKGQLWLPKILVDDITETLYLNLIAYERFHVGAGKDVTSYVFFMDNIIDDVEDIRLLHKKSVIQNGIGSDKEAASLFNSLAKDISLDQKSPLAVVYKRVNAYCERRTPRYRAALYQNYLTNPWASISFFAGIVLFILTMIQTNYTVLQYYNQPQGSSPPPPA